MLYFFIYISIKGALSILFVCFAGRYDSVLGSWQQHANIFGAVSL